MNKSVFEILRKNNITVLLQLYGSSLLQIFTRTYK